MARPVSYVCREPISVSLGMTALIGQICPKPAPWVGEGGGAGSAIWCPEIFFQGMSGAICRRNSGHCRGTQTGGREGVGRLTLLSTPLPEVMVGMGYTREEIKEALTSQKYNEVTATYLLLGRKTEVRGRRGPRECAMSGAEGLRGLRGRELRACHLLAGGWGPGHPGAGPGTGAGAQRHHQRNELQQKQQPQQRAAEFLFHLPPPAQAQRLL